MKKGRDLIKILGRLLIFAVFVLFLVYVYTVKAAPVFDYVNGTYTDDFSDATGIASSSNAGVNAGAVQLKNAGGTYTPPYVASGYVITQSIIPTSLSRWGTFSYVGDVPANTSVKLQVVDEGNTLVADYKLAGNSAGFTQTSVDISSLYPNADFDTGKAMRLRFKLTLATTDPNVTPTITSTAFTWTPKSAVLPTASSLYNSGWPTFGADNQGTSKSLYNGEPTYPVVRWLSDELPKCRYMVPRPQLLTYQENLYFSSRMNQDYVTSINRNTGATNWQKPWNWLEKFGSIDQNGIMYVGTHWQDDTVYAVDLLTTELKWSIQYGGGHGTSNMRIGKDGVIFSARPTGIDQVNGPLILYAYYPNGTVKYTETYPVPAGLTGQPNDFAIGSDGTIYMGASTNIPAPNQEQLFYAINPDDGSVLWSYQTGSISYIPILDNDDNIYIFQQVKTTNTFDAKMISLDSAGNLRWERSVDRNVYLGWSYLALGQDGKLVAIRHRRTSPTPYVLEVINSATGEVIDSLEYTSIAQSLTTDDNHIYTTKYLNSGLPKISVLEALDYDLNVEWAITNPDTVVGNIETTKFLNTFLKDERGWMYGAAFKTIYVDGVRDDDQSVCYAQALAPWTITSDISAADKYEAGDTINFTVTTSMQETNVFTEGANQMQLVMDNADKVALTYSQTLPSGDTLWTGSYVLPGGTSIGTHTYTVQANAEYIKTDIAVNFAVPSTNSDNTGYILESSYTVREPPTVTAQAATHIGFHRGTLNGNITATGGENATTRGFKYYNSNDCTGAENDTSTSGDFGTGAYEAALTTLAANQNYSYRAYATNSMGTGTSGTCVTFNTLTTGSDEEETAEAPPELTEIPTTEEIVEEISQTLHDYYVSEPTASFTVSDDNTTGNAVVFDASGSTSNKGLVEYAWDFGDGITADGIKPNHEYKSPGRYTVTLTVTDRVGNKNTTMKTVDVKPSIPTITNIKAQGADLLIAGKADYNTTVYFTIHSDPFNGQAQTDKEGKWMYTLQNASEIIGQGDHTIFATAVVQVADDTSLESDQSKTYDFKLTVDDGRLRVEMKKTKVWQYTTISAIVLVLIFGYLLWRKTR